MRKYTIIIYLFPIYLQKIFLLFVYSRHFCFSSCFSLILVIFLSLHFRLSFCIWTNKNAHKYKVQRVVTFNAVEKSEGKGRKGFLFLFYLISKARQLLWQPMSSLSIRIIDLKCIDVRGCHWEISQDFGYWKMMWWVMTNPCFSSSQKFLFSLYCQMMSPVRFKVYFKQAHFADSFTIQCQAVHFSDICSEVEQQKRTVLPAISCGMPCYLHNTHKPLSIRLQIM